jgi:hypothetical protein
MDTALKKLKVIVLKQILRDNGLRVGGNKPELIERILNNNIIYENDIKISPVYIQKGMTAKQTVPELKALLKSYGLKLSGRKAELIERLNLHKKISRKGIKPYETMLVADLKKILKKFKLSVKGLKADLVARLYDYDKSREIQEMGLEDLPNTEGISIADAFFPIQSEYDIPRAIPEDISYSPRYYYGDRIGYKYDPEQVREILQRQRLDDPEYAVSRIPQITYDMLEDLLPISDVIRTLKNTTENKIIFKSNMDSDMYSVDDLLEYLYSSGNYSINGWKIDIDPVDNKIAIIYTRIATPSRYMTYIDIKNLKKFLSKDEAKSVTYVYIQIPELKNTILPMNVGEIDVPELNIKDKWNVKINPDGEIVCTNLKRSESLDYISAEIINKKIRII